MRSQGSGFRDQGSGPRAQAYRIRVQGLGFRVKGLGFRGEYLSRQWNGHGEGVPRAGFILCRRDVPLLVV